MFHAYAIYPLKDRLNKNNFKSWLNYKKIRQENEVILEAYCLSERTKVLASNASLDDTAEVTQDSWLWWGL